MSHAPVAQGKNTNNVMEKSPEIVVMSYSYGASPFADIRAL